MLLFRFLVITFNVAVISYLLYRMLEVIKVPMQRWKKTFILVGGVILLLAPLGIFLRFFMPTLQYFVIYPVAIALYLYMIREIR
jgi:hypothetical protein